MRAEPERQFVEVEVAEGCGLGVGNTIQLLRRAADMSGHELSRRVGYKGLSMAAMLERDSRMLSPERLRLMCSALGVSVSHFLTIAFGAPRERSWVGSVSELPDLLGDLVDPSVMDELTDRLTRWRTEVVFSTLGMGSWPGVDDRKEVINDGS